MSQPRLNNQIRFGVYDGENRIHQSEWFPERTPNDAVNVLSDVRKRMGGNFAYRIERTGDSKTPNQVKMYRYKITVGESQFYSKLIVETEKVEALRQIEAQFSQEKFPGRVITETEI